MLKTLVNNIIKYIFPFKCIFCGKVLDTKADIEICEACYKNIRFMDNELWLLDSKDADNSLCDEIICVCEYSGIIKDALIRFKFFNKPGYYRAFARLLANKIQCVTSTKRFDIIISVPLHKQKEKIRGYNQSSLISTMLSKEIGIYENSSILTRVKDTKSQSLLAKGQRHSNIAGAFKVNNPEIVTGKSIVLIDDILTTGSTVNECSRVLKEAGAKEVVAAVIASGRKY